MQQTYLVQKSNKEISFQIVRESNSTLSNWIGVESWCDFGANLVQHFIGRYSRYSRYRTKSHDNQTKWVGKLACQRASADCSTSVLRLAKQSAKHHLERGVARKEYNYDITRYFTLFTISNSVSKTPRDNFDLGRIQKMLRFFGAFFIISFDELRCKLWLPKGKLWLAMPSYDAR